MKIYRDNVFHTILSSYYSDIFTLFNEEVDVVDDNVRLEVDDFLK
jgi:hypothetical protein